MLRRVCASMAGMGQLRLPQPVQRCVPLLPLYPRIADQVDAQVKVIGLVPQAGICSDFGVPTGPIYLRNRLTGSVHFPRENVTNPSRFGIFTFRSVCASIVSLSAMMPLRFRI